MKFQQLLASKRDQRRVARAACPLAVAISIHSSSATCQPPDVVGYGIARARGGYLGNKKSRGRLRTKRMRGARPPPTWRNQGLRTRRRLTLDWRAFKVRGIVIGFESDRRAGGTGTAVAADGHLRRAWPIKARPCAVPPKQRLVEF